MSVFIRECTVADVPELEPFAKRLLQILMEMAKRKGFTGTL